MEKAPFISVIVPNYNHASFLQERLDGVFNQTYLNFEVLLLDDCSTDDSRILLEQYGNHPKVSEVLFNTVNSGSPFKQWQKGIARAKGEYIWIAESDDYCDISFLELLVKRLTPGVSIAYAQSIDVDARGKMISNRIEWTKNFSPNIWNNDFVIQGNVFLEKYLWVKNVIPNASAVIFKKALVTEHTFSDSLLQMRMCGDWLFWMQLSLTGNIAFCSTTLNFFRSHEQTSRRHTTLAIKKLRLIEEGVIRTIMKSNNQHSPSKEDTVLLNMWCALHPLKAIFTVSFYKIKVPGFSKSDYLIKKINNYKS